MKTIKKIIALVVIVLFFIPVSQVLAQGAGPGAPPNEERPGDNPIGGGGAPIGGGLIILTTLGLLYGGKKVYDLRKENKEQE